MITQTKSHFIVLMMIGSLEKIGAEITRDSEGNYFSKQKYAGTNEFKFKAIKISPTLFEVTHHENLFSIV